MQSILLINTNLSTDSCTILPLIHNDIMAGHFRGDNGYLSLFNIYNEITTNNMLTHLDSHLNCNAQQVRPSHQDCVMKLGNLNCNHPIGEEETNERLYKVEEFIAPMIKLLYRIKMHLALPKGIPTFQSTAGNWTRPDNVCRCNTPDDPISRCDIVPVICPPLPDHLPIITILDLPFTRVAKLHVVPPPNGLECASGKILNWPPLTTWREVRASLDYVEWSKFGSRIIHN